MDLCSDLVRLQGEGRSECQVKISQMVMRWMKAGYFP
jgi:hypothetical protein